MNNNTVKRIFLEPVKKTSAPLSATTTTGNAVGAVRGGVATSGTGKISRVAAYCRVSTDTSSQETSFDGQVTTYTNLINSTPGWSFAGIYADDGITGTSVEKRPKFLEMIKDCENGKIDLILTKSISRFARNTLECLQYVRHLNNLGVHILFESNNIDTRNDFSEMILTILAAFAQEESRSISENTKWGIRKRFEAGEGRWCLLYGYDKGYKINPEQAAVVQKIFWLYEHRKSMVEIRAWLKKHKIKSPGGADTWTQQSVNSLLMNERYAGDLLLQKYFTENHINHRTLKNNSTQIPSYYIENHHTPIITKKQFERVTAIRSMKRRQHCREDDVMGVCDQYPLGEKLRCPYCGSVLYQRAVHVQVRQGKGWSCERGEKACKEFIIRSQFVESALLRAYNELNVKAVRRKLENNAATNSAKLKRIKKAAEVMLAIKEKIPAFDTIDYWWVDELVDHIEFGEHSKTQRELLRLKALKKARTSEGKEGAAEESVEQAIIDDRTMRVFWRCGIVSTVPSGVLADKDNPRYVAKLFNDAQQREQDNTLTSENGEARIRRGKKVKTDNQQAEDNQC